MEKLLNDTQKFEKINLKNDRILSLLSTKKGVLENLLRSLLHLAVYLKKQSDL